MVWDGKDAFVQAKAVKPPQRTWLQWLLRMPVPEPDEITYGDNYHPDQGLVALSLPLWDSLLQGLQEGALGSRPLPAPAMEETSSEIPSSELSVERVAEIVGESNTPTPIADKEHVEKVSEEIKKEPETKDEELVTKEPVPSITLSQDNLPAEFPLPPLGFLPGDKELPFRTRIFGFFHRRVTTDTVGGAALKIALGKTVPATLSPMNTTDKRKEDDPSTDSLSEDFASQVDVYV
jgi:hypothetical protein